MSCRRPKVPTKSSACFSCAMEVTKPIVLADKRDLTFRSSSHFSLSPDVIKTPFGAGYCFAAEARRRLSSVASQVF
jgi:hypothetical protein